MGKVKEVLKDISRTRRVEKEFASDAERKVVQAKDKNTVGIKVNEFEELP